MLKMKKVLSVALVIVIALSTMVMSTSALDNGKKIGFIVKADKTESEIVTGAKVTVTVALELDDFSKNLSDAKFALMYDDTVYKPDLSTRTFLGDWDEYCAKTASPSINPMFYKNVILKQSTMTDTEKASYNNCVLQAASANTTGGAHSPTVGYKPTESANGVTVDQFSIVFEVIGDADALAKGNKNIMISDAISKNAQYAKYASVNASGKPIAAFFDKAVIDLSKANIMANMPSAPSYAVAKYKTQVKFTGDKTTAPDDLFQFRLTSVITAADFAAMNSNGNTIKSVGFIAANTGAADAADAKAAVEKGTALPSAWKAASTDYVSQANASSDAYFGAIVKNISHASQATDIDCIAYVCYNDGTADHYVWYSAAVTAKVASGYDAAVAAWKAQ